MKTFPVQALTVGLISAVGWVAQQGGAQQVAPPSPPVLKPKITVVGKLSDTAADGASV